MKSRKEYMRKWREANPDRIEEYKKRKRTKRYCKDCNGNVDKYKLYCSECLSVRQEEQKKRHNLEQTEYRKERYDNRDKDAYNAYHREYQRGKKFRAYQKKYIKDRYQNDPEFRERVHEHQRKYFKKRYHTDIEFREKHLAIRRHRYRMDKKSWYKLRIERIEKLKKMANEIL